LDLLGRAISTGLAPALLIIVAFEQGEQAKFDYDIEIEINFTQKNAI